MSYYRIQMHPNWSDYSVVFAKEGLKYMGAIGLDFGLGEDPLENLPLNSWTNPDDFEKAKKIHERLHGNEGVTKSLVDFYQLRQGNIVLLHGGMTPVALVEVIGPYYMERNNNQKNSGLRWKEEEQYWDWPRHRFPVKVLGWYEEDKNICDDLSWRPPAQGTFGKLIDTTSETFKKMSIWEIFSKNKPGPVGEPPVDGYNNPLESLTNVFKIFKQIILHGPPGTSKTYQAKRMAAKLILDKTDEEVNNLVSEEEKSGSGELSEKRFKIIRKQNQIDSYKGQWAIVQFHPAYNYEDFVRGIQVSGQDEKIRYENVQRIFSAMCKAAEAEKDPDKKYVLIIDEINRAHIAAVLGELIYGLEYRNARITTPYAIEGDDTLSVPDNLYIIGTMNTADRSIGHIDYAVRRRFAFVACPPDLGVLTDYYSGKEAMGERAKQLFEAVRNVFNKENLNEFDVEDVCPGHTYFMADDETKLWNKFIYQVYPLLREYYKDGIFRQNVTQLKLPNDNIVSLNQAVPPRELLDKLQGASSTSTV